MRQHGRKSLIQRIALGLAACALAVQASGCVQRRMTIRSNPPGAMVYVDDYPIGTTPVSTDYTYYGTRKIRLVSPGYETLTVYQPMPAPWYQWFGIDFISENFWPGEIRDERTFDYQMATATTVPTEQLLGNADQLRNASRAMAAANPPPVVVEPAPATGPSPIGPPTTNVLPPEMIAPPAMSPNVLPPPGQMPPEAMPPYDPSGGVVYPPPGGTPNYGVPGGTLPPGQTPAYPSYPTYPSYPGSELPAPSNVPSDTPLFAPPPTGPPASPGVFPGMQPTNPATPPGWRPISQAPGGERY